jgi:hypothetical protein
MKKSFQYVIKVNGKVIWKGMNPQKKYLELQKKFRQKSVSLVWVPREGVLVCRV